MSAVSTYTRLGLPNEVTVIIFTISLIASLAPFVAGADFGIFKVPDFPQHVRSKLRIFGPLLLALAFLLFLPLWLTSRPIEPELTRRGPSDGNVPGIYIVGTQEFIHWETLKNEIETKLLPQVLQVPAGSKAVLQDFHGKPNWVIAIVFPNKEAFVNVWFGPDPKKHWKFDGLVRIGQPIADNVAVVWQTFQRYSDGEYRRL